MAPLWHCVFLLSIGATVSTVADLHKRIYGGQECPKDKRLYHVKLIAVGVDGCSSCGGSLINSKWILTAAHCYEDASAIFAVIGPHQGENKLVQITRKPEIYEDTQKRPHDIMLLELPDPITHIPPVLFSRCNKPLQGSVQIAGYGSPKATWFTWFTWSKRKRLPGASETLQCADLNVINCDPLKKYLQTTDPEYYEEINYQHIFCGYSKKSDICPGDSGGAVLHEDRIAGVIKFTGDPKYVCSRGAGFIDVCKYKDWIGKTANLPP